MEYITDITRLQGILNCYFEITTGVSNDKTNTGICEMEAT
jgi:hypothetical protein